ncbi:translation initiation factor eIF3 subunit g [Spiromyces aspiralis]|uniref:Translation initiation factor eIF3 subunit g n=1 Tax=Spiromyces aspiralis TaxID=68401 RepID=A0ACC1HUP7_9FUNG|nr:translation initiation factor eIF3 subunit g [Spiromyces aspiralis]
MPPQTSWADDDGIDGSVLPTPIVTVDENGIKTTIEYKLNEEGKKIKVTRRTETRVVKREVNKAVAERKTWRKFGLERGHGSGPNSDTTTTGENVFLKLNQFGYNAAEAEEEEKNAQESTKPKNSKIMCRVCRGEHFTARCPNKDRLATPETLSQLMNPEESAGDGGASTPGGMDAAKAAGGSSYVPPHLRNRAGGAAAPGVGFSLLDREEKYSVRLTNLSDTVEEEDLRALCRRFGFRAHRINIPKSYDGSPRGFAFIDFFEKSDMEAAVEKFNGLPFHNVIINAEPARK